MISRVTGVHLHDYGCTLKAYRREVLAEMRLYGEMHRFIPALASWSGARIAECVVNHRPRTAGKAKYGLARTLKVVLDLMTVKFLGSYLHQADLRLRRPGPVHRSAGDPLRRARDLSEDSGRPRRT